MIAAEAERFSLLSQAVLSEVDEIVTTIRERSPADTMRTGRSPLLSGDPGHRTPRAAINESPGRQSGRSWNKSA
jgi:hypothetical protein